MFLIYETRARDNDRSNKLHNLAGVDCHFVQCSAVLFKLLCVNCNDINIKSIAGKTCFLFLLCNEDSDDVAQ